MIKVSNHIKKPDLHEVETNDYPKRLDFCNCLKGLLKVTYLAYFCLTPTVNKQNNRFWLKSKPTEGVEHPLYDEKVLVWCAMSSKRIYGPYFFNSTITEESYLRMLKFFMPKIFLYQILSIHS